MRVIDLALKDLQQLVRSRQTFIFLLIMPVVFTILFGFAFGGDSTADPRLPIAVHDADQSALSQEVVAALGSSDVVRLEASEATAAELPQLVADEDVAAAIMIPAGFGEALRTAGAAPLPIDLVAGGQTAFTVQSELSQISTRLVSTVNSALYTAETAAAHGLAPDDAAQAGQFDAALARGLAAWEAPPVTVNVTAASALSAEAGEDNANYSVYAHSSPGMMAQFAIAGLMGAAGLLVIEKKNRALDRMLTTNMTRGQILLGHFIAMFAMIMMQLGILILFGQLVLGLPYLSQPLATLLVTVATAIFSASLGLLIGVLAKSEEQVIVFALIPMFVLAGLGGAWVPLEFTPETFQRVAYMTPVAWTVDGYKDIIVRGLGVQSVLTGVGVLLAYAAVIAALAAWRFRSE